MVWIDEAVFACLGLFFLLLAFLVEGLIDLVSLLTVALSLAIIAMLMLLGQAAAECTEALS